MIAAWAENRLLKVPGSTIWVPGWASSARMIIAIRPADEEEDEGGADVLDPDHLVIGVELEVVLPASRRRGSEWSSGMVGRARPPSGTSSRRPPSPTRKPSGAGDQRDDHAAGSRSARSGSRGQAGEHAQERRRARSRTRNRSGRPSAPAPEPRSLQCRYQVLPPVGRLSIALRPPGRRAVAGSRGDPVADPVEVPGTRLRLRSAWRASSSNWSGGTTCTRARIVACPKPQSSVQTTL